MTPPNLYIYIYIAPCKLISSHPFKTKNFNMGCYVKHRHSGVLDCEVEVKCPVYIRIFYAESAAGSLIGVFLNKCSKSRGLKVFITLRSVSPG